MSGAGPPPTTIRGARVVVDGVARDGPLHLAGGRVADAVPDGVAPFVLDLPGHLLIPALVNAHDHLTLNVFPRPEDVGVHASSYDWIAAFAPRLEEPGLRRLRAIPHGVRAWQGGLKNLLSGALLVAHHDPWDGAFDDPAFPVDVLRRSGWCHSLGLAPAYGPSPPEAFRATPPDRPFFLHLAEGTDAVAASELSALDASGLLDGRTVLVHGVGLGLRDVELLLERGAGVVWCPSSNLFMLGTTLDPSRLAAAGALALATDSRLTGAADLLAELRVAAAASALSPAQLLALVTTAPARLLRAPDSGTLRPGARADLLVLRDGGGDPAAALLEASRADLRAVVRAGAPAVADRDLAGWFEAARVEALPVFLDGRPKLCAASALRVPEAAALEPGLEAGPA